MNLIQRAWIPCVYQDCSFQTIGLKELYEKAEKIKDLSLSPPERVAVTRLLICITQVALKGPKDEAEWKHCYQRIKGKSLEYMEEHYDKFELFSPETGFLQINGLEPLRNAALDKLDFSLASGHSPTLFDHGAGEDGRFHAPEWCALKLLTYQCFSPGGTIGETTWRGKKTGRHSKDAPCVESSALHTIIRGDNLLRTIHFNLITKEQIKSLVSKNWGVPVWEMMPEQQEGKTTRDLACSYLGRLVPVSRGVKLSPGEKFFTLVDGVKYPKLPEYRDTMMTVKSSAKGPLYLRIDLSKHPWRELSAILNLRQFGEEGGPLALARLKGLENGDIDIWVGGMVSEKAKIIDVAEWNFSVPVELLGSLFLRQYEEGVSLAEKISGRLGEAVKVYHKILGADDRNFLRDTVGKAKGVYWNEMNGKYDELVEVALHTEETLDGWKKCAKSVALRVFEETCPRKTPRQIEAFIFSKKKV